MELVLILLALVGHGYLWAAFFNHTHSTAWPRWIVSPSSVVGFACAVLIPVGFGLWFVREQPSALGGDHRLWLVWLGRFYLGACWIAGVATTLRWAWRRVLRRPPDVLRYERITSRGPLRPANPGLSEKDGQDVLVRLPGNQILQLEVVERALEVPRLAPALDRLTILHFSDLHFTGRVPKAYFQALVQLANGLEPDLVAITGDLVDYAECIDWIPDTLGKLTSRFGTYCILGNHDTWTDTDRLRQTLSDSGLIDVGSRWLDIRIHGEPVILAGNELPWVLPAADLEHAPPRSPNGGPLRIVLAHCPDQLAWARANEVDLLLAGHTHGGQFRFPLVGPVLSASRLGAAYSSGTFYVPPTVMHVTRGVSARFPVRIGCPPEIVKLVLRTGLPPEP